MGREFFTAEAQRFRRGSQRILCVNSAKPLRLCGEILLCFLLLLPAVAQDKNAPPLINAETTPEKNLKVFDALWEKVNKDYFDPNFNGANWAKLKETYRPQAAQATTKQALRRVLEQMTDELKTSHVTVFFTVKRNQLERAVAQKVDRKYDRIFITTGMEWMPLDGQYVVTNVYANTAAAAAGIQPGWIITQYNGKPLPLPEAEELYEGMEISCRLLDLNQQEREVKLKYGWSVQRPQHKAEFLANEIGYVRLDGFTLDSEKLMEQAVQRFKTTKAMIVDMRGNEGGYEYALRHCLEQFFATPTAYGTTIERSGKVEQPKLKGRGAKAYAGKVIVLTDQASGSCAEIFAAIMQESKRGQIVGRITAGAVLYSQTHRLPEGFLLSLAFRDYLTPNGRRLEGKGVAPDVSVPYTIDDVRRQRDPDLARALELLQ